MTSKKKILIVDDSTVIQKLLFVTLSKEPDFEIVGVCSDPFEAKEYILNGEVDCMILDLEMPKMDGMTFLKKLMQTHPLKIIILSGAVETNPALVDSLIKFGAHSVFAKPNGFSTTTFDLLKTSIRTTSSHATKHSVGSKTAHAPKEFLLIAASTGGTEGVKKILTSLPYNPDVAVIIIQHMAAKFTKTFAESLDKLSEYIVKEAENNDSVVAGTAYIAPGNFHIEVIKQDRTKIMIESNQKPHMHSVRPAADITFLSFPVELAKHSTAVVLSGMGKDGAEGIAYLKKNGAHTMAESEASCVVFGMPKAAIQTGCIDEVLSIDEICQHLDKKFRIENAA